jgi:hypothetical protein
MKRAIFALTVILVGTLILFPGNGQAQMGPGMTGEEEYGQWNYCPYCGQPLWGPGMMGPGYGRGPGMMGPGYERGYGMRHPGWRRGPCMMGPGYGMGPGMMQRDWGRGPQYGPQYQQPREPLEEKDVKEMLENYLKSTRNPNLKLGNIEDKGSYFEAEILTKDDSLADKIAVDKTTGWMRSIY